MAEPLLHQDPGPEAQLARPSMALRAAEAVAKTVPAPEDAPVRGTKSAVYAETGGGDSRENDLETWRDTLLEDWNNIWQTYQPEKRGDENIANLLNPIGIIATMAASEGSRPNLARYVASEIDDFSKSGEGADAATVTYISGQIADSLGLLQNAFWNTVGADPKKPYTDAWAQAEQFMKDTCPSPLWEDEKLRDIMLQAIGTTYAIVGVWLDRSTFEDSPNKYRRAVERFIKELQDEFMVQGGVVKQASRVPRIRKDQIRRAREKRRRAA